MKKILGLPTLRLLAAGCLAIGLCAASACSDDGEAEGDKKPDAPAASADEGEITAENAEAVADALEKAIAAESAEGAGEAAPKAEEKAKEEK